MTERQSSHRTVRLEGCKDSVLYLLTNGLAESVIYDPLEGGS